MPSSPCAPAPAPPPPSCPPPPAPPPHLHPPPSAPARSPVQPPPPARSPSPPLPLGPAPEPERRPAPPPRRARTRPRLARLDTSPLLSPHASTSSSRLAFSVFPPQASEQGRILSDSDAGAFVSSPLDEGEPVSLDPTFVPPARGGISCVVPGFLYLGPDVTCREDVDALRRHGIARILNMAAEIPEGSAPLDLQRQFTYLKIPLMDSVVETGVQASIRRACEFLDGARTAHERTYVHCKAGQSRSVLIAIAYLMHSEHRSWRSAYQYVLDQRPVACPNLAFIAELMAFERHLAQTRPLCPPHSSRGSDHAAPTPSSSTGHASSGTFPSSFYRFTGSNGWTSPPSAGEGEDQSESFAECMMDKEVPGEGEAKEEAESEAEAPTPSTYSSCASSSSRAMALDAANSSPLSPLIAPRSPPSSFSGSSFSTSGLPAYAGPASCAAPSAGASTHFLRSPPRR